MFQSGEQHKILLVGEISVGKLLRKKNVLKSDELIKTLFKKMPSPQYRYWILTIPVDKWCVENLNSFIDYCKGQREIGEGGYEHWQLIAYVAKKCTYSKMISLWPTEAHVEHTRSAKAEQYVWKEDTRVEGSQFEEGVKPMNRNSSKDWDLMFKNAQEAKFDEIPADVKIRCWHQFQSISKFYMQPMDRGLVVSKIFWGVPGSGKTHLAKLESGYFEDPTDVYIKIPTTKFWDGYRGQTKVLIDEFDGQINSSHIKVWCDPSGTACQVEVKGGAVPLKATQIWITSNKDWRAWYPGDNYEALALKRRFQIKEFTMVYNS